MNATITRISDTLYQLNEAADFAGNGHPQPYVDAYLLLGREKAALIDCLQTAENVWEEIRRITDLPLEVLITHGHGDHAGAGLKELAARKVPIYMDLADLNLLRGMNPEAEEGWFTPLADGMKFDLGGCVLEAIACGGHSKGSYAFLDEERQLLFSGDSIGSGVFWMQLESCLPLHSFLPNVERLWERVKSLPDLLVYPGHRNQSPVQLNGQYVRDVYTITQRILNGDLIGEDRVMDHHGRRMEYQEVSYGMMQSYCFSAQHLH